MSKEVRSEVRHLMSSRILIQCVLLLVFFFIFYSPNAIFLSFMAFDYNTNLRINLLHWTVSNLGTKPVTAFFVIQSWIISFGSLVYYYSVENEDVNDESLRKSAIECKEKKVLTNCKILEKIEEMNENVATLHQQQENKMTEMMDEIKKLLNALHEKPIQGPS